MSQHNLKSRQAIDARQTDREEETARPGKDREQGRVVEGGTGETNQPITEGKHGKQN